MPGGTMFAKNTMFILAAMAAFALGVTACGDDDTTDYTPDAAPTADTATDEPDAPSGDAGSHDANAGDAGNFDAGGDTTYEDYCELCLAAGLECFPPEEVETKSSDDPQVVMVANWPCVDPVETETDPCDPYYEIEELLWTCEGTAVEDDRFILYSEPDGCYVGLENENGEYLHEFEYDGTTLTVWIGRFEKICISS